MAQKITGRIVAISQTLQQQTRSGQTFAYKNITIDCTRFDPLTGQPSQFKNTPQFECQERMFPAIEKITPGDLVTISYEIQGFPYKDRNGNEQIFTKIRPFAIEKYITQNKTHNSYTQQATTPSQNAITEQPAANALQYTQNEDNALPF